MLCRAQIAAITIQADNVVLDLNGHKVSRGRRSNGSGIAIYGAKNVTDQKWYRGEVHNGQGIVILSNAESG